MHKIILKTYELIDALEESDIIKDLTMAKNILLKDKQVLNDIKLVNDDNLISLKQKLYNNTMYKQYMNNYNKLFYIVLEINNRYKKIIDNRMCIK